MSRNIGRISGAVAGLILAGLHLAYEAVNGGVISHHLLADPEMPAISNWFGLIALPVLGSFAGLRLSQSSAVPWQWLIGLTLAIGYGAAIAIAFEISEDMIAQRLFVALFAVAVLLPIYRPECVFGFVLGMTFTFGAVIPSALAVVVALESRLLHPIARYILRRLIDSQGPDEGGR